MAVGSADLPVLHPIAGVRIGISSAGIKKVGRKDLVIFEIDQGATIAGTFTKNAFCAAPVHIAKNNLATANFSPTNSSRAATRYLIINTGHSA